MLRNNPLNIVEETKIVALLARGDSYLQIRKQFTKEFERTLSLETIRKIRDRNAENLKIIMSRTLEKQEVDVLQIRAKANRKIENRLDLDSKQQDLLIKANEDFLNDKIDLQEYTKLVKSVKQLSVSDLVNVSKEMHAQSAGDPAPQGNPQDMARIAAALQNSDEVQLNQLVFKPKETPSDGQS